MSVGGVVVEAIRLPDRWWINTRETVTNRECAIYVEHFESDEWLLAGDSLWWQGGRAYWTPQTRERQDVQIPRIGYSGVPRPTMEAETR